MEMQTKYFNFPKVTWHAIGGEAGVLHTQLRVTLGLDDVISLPHSTPHLSRIISVAEGVILPVYTCRNRNVNSRAVVPGIDNVGDNRGLGLKGVKEYRGNGGREPMPCLGVWPGGADMEGSQRESLKGNDLQDALKADSERSNCFPRMLRLGLS